MTVLVTGGAGYIGAHVVRLLRERGDHVVIVDDLATGFAARVEGVPMEVFDLSEASAAERLATLMRTHGVTAVIHFAARKQVAESVAQPLRYFGENVGGVLNVLDAMRRSEVRDVVFSSSAAVYGDSDSGVVSETDPPHPMSPYGQTKLVGEWLVEDAAVAHGFRGTSLRYFNVAGAGASDLADRAVLNLIPMVFERLDAGLAPLIFGDDYATPDGTCVRDYIHVLDLAEAHLVALDRLRASELASASVFNVGTGVGYSVGEVIRVIGEVSGIAATPEVGPRRAGDPARVVANPGLINRELDWSARRTLRDMVTSSWEGWQAVRGSAT
jgi:UDP-glucose 4-epimerase